MIYANILKELVQDETNPVKKMYLNELILSWKKALNLLEADFEKNTVELFTDAMNSHLNLLKNPKFLYHPREAENGFKNTHPIFGPTYLRDLINLLLKPTGLLINPALDTDFQSFNYNMHLKPMSFIDTLLRHQICFDTSDPVYSVCMKLDLQYKPAQKKMFSKEFISFPLMIFFIFRNYGKQEFNQVELLKQQLLSSNPNAFLCIVTETIDKNAVNYYTNHQKDLFILKKSLSNNTENEYALEVVQALQTKIFDYIKAKHIEYPDFVKKGFYSVQPDNTTVQESPKKNFQKNHKRRNNEQSADK
jgi:hypothetical protein